MASAAGPGNEINNSNNLEYVQPEVLSSANVSKGNVSITESELRSRVVIILNNMTEEQRRSLINAVKGESMENYSVLVLKDKSNDEDVQTSVAFVRQLLLENWANQYNRDHDAEITVPKRVANFPQPKPPGCFGKLSRKMRWGLVLSTLALVAIICAGVLFAGLYFLRSESEARPSSFVVFAQFQNSIPTTGFDGDSLRYDHRHQRAFVASITNGSVKVLAWNGHQVQNLQFDVRHILGDSLGQRRCSLLSITTSNRSVLFCVSPSRTNESSMAFNLFNDDDQLREIHFPGSDSTHKIVLMEMVETDKTMIWYSLQLKNRLSNTSSLTYDAGVGFGLISASESALIRIANGFSKVTDEDLDKPWSVFAMRAEKSDHSLNVLYLQPTIKVGGVCNFAYIKNTLIKRNCTTFENLVDHFNSSMGISRIIPAESLEPPKGMLVRGKYMNDREWTKIWVVYAITHISDLNNWLPSIGHIYLSFYDMNGRHIGNVTHNTADDVKFQQQNSTGLYVTTADYSGSIARNMSEGVRLSQQNPTGLVVPSEDSLFVWFSEHDGSSSLARYKFTVCFDERSINCSPLLFEI